MTALFILFFATLILAYKGQFKWVYRLQILAWVVCALLLGFFMTSTLQIRW